MDTAVLNADPGSALESQMDPAAKRRVIGAAEFRDLLVSHRRMIRVDRREDRLRGLQDLDTGELFLTDERRLLELQR